MKLSAPPPGSFSCLQTLLLKFSDLAFRVWNLYLSIILKPYLHDIIHLLTGCMSKEVSVYYISETF